MANKLRIYQRSEMKSQFPLLFVVIFFAILYSLIAFVNHYLFRTSACDMGIYTNAIYDYAHFRWNDSTVYSQKAMNLLSDHFELDLLLLSPLSYIFGTYTLQIIQIISILLGGLGIYKYFEDSKPDNSFLPLAACLYFYLFYGVFAALAFDFHNNVIAASLLPWFFLLLKKENYKKASILFIFILFAKENMAFWMFFVAIGLLLMNYKNKKKRTFLVAIASISLVYFILIINYIMPSIGNGQGYPHFNYSVLGNSMSSAFVHLIQHPVQSFQILFTNHIHHPFGDYVKTELHLFLLFSGLFFLLKKPAYIFMLIPVYFQKLFNNDVAIWGISFHYSIEFAPVLAIGIFSVIMEIKSAKLQKILLISVLILVSGVTIRSMDHTIFFTDKAKIRIYQSAHYQRNYKFEDIYSSMKKIPKDAIVSCQSAFLPHLALRDKIYTFPIIKDAEYILVSFKESPYPLAKNEFVDTIHNLLENPNWQILTKSENCIVLKRNSSD